MKRHFRFLLLFLLTAVPLSLPSCASTGEPLYAVREPNGLWGYIDRQGVQVIPGTFTYAEDFQGGYAVAGHEFTAYIQFPLFGNLEHTKDPGKRRLAASVPSENSGIRPFGHAKRNAAKRPYGRIRFFAGIGEGNVFGDYLIVFVHYKFHLKDSFATLPILRTEAEDPKRRRADRVHRL